MDAVDAKGYVDPFWLENREEIVDVIDTISYPHTEAGKELLVKAADYPVFQEYRRIHPIFGSTVAIIELDEIAKKSGEDYFSELKNRRLILKAFGSLLEKRIKTPDLADKDRGYDDYKVFFENTLRRVKQLDQQETGGINRPNFANSLFMVFNQEVASLYKPSFPLEATAIRRTISTSIT